MHHRSRVTKALRSGRKELRKLGNGGMARRGLTSLLAPALFIAGSVAVGFVVARFLRTSSRSRGIDAQPVATRDDFSEAVVVGGTASMPPSRSMPEAEEWLPERTSTPPPSSFVTDNPDIPTLSPERDGVEWERASEPAQHKP